MFLSDLLTSGNDIDHLNRLTCTLICTIFPLLSETQVHFSVFCCYYNSLGKEVEPKRLYPRAIVQKEKNSTHDYDRNKRPLQKGTRLQSGSQRKPFFLSAGLSIRYARGLYVVDYFLFGAPKSILECK